MASLLRDALARELKESGIEILKIGYLLVRETELSQRVAGIVFNQFRDVAGIMSPSTMGTDFENFAVFERNSERGDLRTEIRVVSTTQLSADTPELSIALEHLGLS